MLSEFAEVIRENISKWRKMLLGLMSMNPQLFHIKAVIFSTCTGECGHVQNYIQQQEGERVKQVKQGGGKMPTGQS